ncbi:MAG: hypothetical protein MJ158_03035, partial [Alphaproteobacteria bacterium]|nr:hypothetical protein [Alphaproteobacteria bacterium]
MKKIVSLTVLTTLLAGCMGTDSTTSTTTTYGYDGFSEEKLVTTDSMDTLNNTYLLAAGPKYHIGTPHKIGDIQLENPFSNISTD